MDKVSKGKYVLPAYLSPEASDLITRLLQRDPERRLSLHQVLGHSFFRKHLSQPQPFLGTAASLATPQNHTTGRKVSLDSPEPSFSSFSLEFSADSPFTSSSSDHLPVPYQSTPAASRTVELHSQVHTHQQQYQQPLRPWRAPSQESHGLHGPSFPLTREPPPVVSAFVSQRTLPPLAPIHSNRPQTLPPTLTPEERGEKLMPFCTTKLAPVRQRTSRGFLEILSNGSVILSLDEERHNMVCESGGGLV